jgi:hypothetical protein
MFAIAVVAVAAAVAAWLRPMPEAKSAAPSAPTFSAQQVADAKSKVCAAYAKIHRVVDINAPRNGGNDPTAQLGCSEHEAGLRRGQRLTVDDACRRTGNSE